MPVTITPEQRDAIFRTFCDHVEDGDTIPQACKAADIGWASVARWIANDTLRLAIDPTDPSSPAESYGTRYARARLNSGEGYAIRAQKAAEDATAENVQVKRLQVDTYKWRAAMANPKAYGDRKQVEVSGGVEHLHIDALRRVSAKVTPANALPSHVLPSSNATVSSDDAHLLDAE